MLTRYGKRLSNRKAPGKLPPRKKPHGPRQPDAKPNARRPPDKLPPGMKQRELKQPNVKPNARRPPGKLLPRKRLRELKQPGAKPNDRKRTRQNSTHITLSYASFCFKK